MARKLPKKKGSQNLVALEPQLAIATIGIFSMLVDGEMGNIENYALGEFLSEVDLYADYSEEDFDNLAAEALALLEDPSAAIGQAIASLEDEASREAAYITALLVISIDDDIPEDEENYIADLQKALNISDERADEIICELFGEEDEE
jgi:hypothetical protein